MSDFSSLVRKALLAESKELELLPGVVVTVARTPVGEGLAAYMSLTNRRKVNIWDKVKLSDEERASNELSPDNLKIFNEGLANCEAEDHQDLIAALYYSIARLDPSISREDIVLCIDGGNQEKAIATLIEVNTFDRSKFPKEEPQLGSQTTTEPVTMNSTPENGVTL